MHSARIFTTLALVALTFTLQVSPSLGRAVNSAPLLGEQESTLEDSDFVFDLGGSQPTLDRSGGQQFVLDRENLPALALSNGRNGGGGTQVLFRFAPCGKFRRSFLPRAKASSKKVMQLAHEQV